MIRVLSAHPRYGPRPPERRAGRLCSALAGKVDNGKNAVLIYVKQGQGAA